MFQQPQERVRIAAQGGAAGLPGGAGQGGQQPEIGVGQVARVFAAGQRGIHTTTLSRAHDAGLGRQPGDGISGKAGGSGTAGVSGKSAMEAVKVCRKFWPPTGPSSPAQKKPAMGTGPSISASRPAS